MDSTGGPCLGLHLSDLQHLAKDILTSVRGPFITIFSHSTGRRDRINCCHITHRISHMGSRLIPFYCFCYKTHNRFSPFFIIAFGYDKPVIFKCFLALYTMSQISMLIISNQGEFIVYINKMNIVKSLLNALHFYLEVRKNEIHISMLKGYMQ